MSRIMALLALCVLVGAPGMAFELNRNLVGRVSVFTNDFLGDGHDRWRTASYFRSTFFGPVWTGDHQPGERRYELRLRGEVIAPTDASQPPMAGERPYVGMAAVGLYSHFGRGRVGYRVGGELVAVGPQTGISSLVETGHDILGFPAPLAASGELANDFYPTFSAEAYRLIPRSGGRAFDLRPFVEVQSGVETLARVGIDAIFGNSIDGALMTRDPVTGQILNVATVRRQKGLMPSIGADIAYVQSSNYLPASSGLTVKRARMRVRAGGRYVSGGRDLFLGFTWLGPEYEGQPSGQVIGSLSFNYRF